MTRVWNETTAIIGNMRKRCGALMLVVLLGGVSACGSTSGPTATSGGPGGPASQPRVIVDPLALFYVGMDMNDDLIVTRAEFEDRAPIQFV
ncbi:MAG: hypothetical protein AAF225_14545, partial [Pseudomonadota bacterium]